MFYAKVILFFALVLMLFVLAFTGASKAEAQELPKNLPSSHCSSLNHLSGQKLWKHYLWHLCNENQAKYLRISSVINRESRWNPRAANPDSSARGLAQFLSIWYSGKWHFNPCNPILSIRVMVYVWNRPSLGGEGNWAL